MSATRAEAITTAASRPAGQHRRHARPAPRAAWNARAPASASHWAWSDF